MKDLLPALLLVVCGLSGLSLVMKKDHRSDYDALNSNDSPNSIHIHAEEGINSLANSGIHILDKEDIIISGDSICRTRF